MATQSAAGDSSNNRSKTILIVDDLPANRALLTATLSLAGYFVFEATSGAECLHLLERLRPCLILLDVMMPELDGFETCSRIRQDPELRQIPIAFLTSYSTEDYLRRGMVVGGNDFIAKPFDIDVLLKRVAHWMGARRGQFAPKPASAPFNRVS